MKALVIRLLLLIPMTGMILGCASTTSSEFPPPIPRQGWVPQQEVYNLEKVITENGPASWVQELDNGYTEAAWITRKSRSRVFLKVMTFDRFDREKRFISSRKKVASPMRMGRGYSKTKSSTPKSSSASRVTLMPWQTDTIQRRYDRPVAKVLAAARVSLSTLGTINSEEKTKNVIAGRIDTRYVWIKVEPDKQSPGNISAVTFQVRTRFGSSDMRVAADLAQQTTLALIRAENAGQPLKKPEAQLGKVMLVDKSLSFVVVDFGPNVKPVAGLKYLVYRGGKQIGEVTTTKQTDGPYIVANINKGDIRTGDSLQLPKLQPKP